MPTAIYTPRINNNDDTVRFSAMLVEPGAEVRKGDPILEVETDKASFTVEASTDGYLLGVQGQIGDTLDVGSILAWIGAEANEPIPVLQAASANGNGDEAQAPTLKALLLLKSYGLKVSEVPHSGRLTAEDVQRFAAGRPIVSQRASAPPLTAPSAPGRVEPLTPERKGMIRTVSWHRDEAAAGYIELPYDAQAWSDYASEFQKAHSLLLSPLLPLMAWRLAQLAVKNPDINATVNGGLYRYDKINLAFTVQAGASLYIVVVQDAGARSAEDFVREMGDLQRAAMKHSLRVDQSSDGTIGFTSMSRWNVSRHVPILLPHTSLMVAHSAVDGGIAHLGASYDHRVLTGFDVVKLLQQLVKPVD